MKRIGTYLNQKGEKFTIFLQDAQVPSDATYWGYFFVVEDSQKRQIPFSALIKKDSLSRKQDADKFVIGDPLNYLQGLLDATEDGKTPLMGPTTKDWFVMPGRSR